MQKTDLNVSPYYDDFDSNDNFQRVLFRPGFAVQARELTTLQSILQNQIERHGRHFFKEGTIVIPGQISFTNEYYAVKLQASFLEAQVDTYLSSYIGTTITGSISGVTAKVISVETSTTTDAPTLYVKYLSTATKEATATSTTGASVINETDTFVDGEHLQSDANINSQGIGSNSSTLLTSNSTATGSSAKIEEGVYFVRGQFVKVLEQRIILDKYTNTPSYRVGLTITESLITPEADTTLLDNATGSSNANAKGAHRLKLTLTLDKLAIGSAADENFIELMRISNGNVQEIYNRTDYNIFEETQARRTFDESGDYAVRPFGIDIRENLNDGSNEGVYESTQTTDSGNTPSESLATIQIDPGKAYIKGYEVETVVPTFIDLEKPRNSQEFDSAITNVEVGNIVKVNNVNGSPDINFVTTDVPAAYKEITLHNLVNASQGTAPSSSQIGVARPRAFEHASGNTGSNVHQLASSSLKTSVFNLYLFDIRMFTTLVMSGTPSGGLTQGAQLTGSTSGATGFLHSHASGTIQLVTVSGTFSIGEKLKSSDSTLADQFLETSGNTDVTISSITIQSFSDVKSVFSNLGAANDDFTADVVLDNIVTLGGSVSMNGSNANVTGFGTTFTKDLKEGDIVTVPGAGSGADLTSRVATLTNDTTMVLADNSASAVTTVPITRNRGKLIDQEKNILLRKLRKSVIKTLKTTTNNGLSQTTQVVRKQFTGTTDASGSVTFTAEDNETFAAESNTDFVLQIINAGGGSPSAANGDIVNLSSSRITFTPSANSVTIEDADASNRVLGTSTTKVKLTATMTRTVASEKLKTKQPAHLVSVNNAAGNNQQAIYGTDAKHKEISLGVADTYKLYAVLDSEDTTQSATLPSSAFSGLSGTLQRGEVLIGNDSQCRAVYIGTSGSSVLYIVTNSRSFISGETINAQTSGASFTIGAFTAGSKDITKNFTLDTGQRDNFYDISRVVRNSGRPTPTGKLLIVCDYFTHGSGDYFTVDSYRGIDYKEIPVYTATRVDPETRTPSGEFDLRDTVDYRPRVADASTSNVTIQSMITKRITSKSFDFSSRAFTGTGSSEILIPKDNSQFQYDFEFYVARKDLLFITEQGKFKLIKGVDDELPEFPKAIEKAMMIATLESPPYILDINDIKFTKIQNRRYTMRDIGKIADRINRLEYYTALTLLEKDAEGFQIQDENGLDRFKSGFIVDNFSGHSVGDVQNVDYKNAIDYEFNELRPKFFMKGVTLKEENDTDAERTADGYQKTNDMITLPYTDVVSIEQPYATRVENLNPVLTFTWTGVCTLNPSGDEWFEVNRLPALIINREGNFDQLVAQVGNAMGTIWNSWQTQWSGTSTSSRVTGINFSSARTGRRQITTFRNTTTRTTTTRTTRSARTGVNTQVVEQIDHESQGDKIRSVAMIPFMRSINITFVAEGMKPNTKVYPFFDKQKVSSHVTPKSDKFTPQGVAAVKGAQLVTNGNGSCKGTFLIPDPNVSGNPQFKTGERLFRLTSSSNNTTNPEPTTFAQELFSSIGLLRTVQEEIIATRNGRIQVTQVSQSSTSTQVLSQSDSTATTVESVRTFDPLAQTFKSGEPGGEMITKINVFFQRKDASIPVLCQIREVVNGFPTLKQLPFAGKHIPPYMTGADGGDATVAMSINSTTVTGTNTEFLTGEHNLKVGDTITINGAGSSTSGVTGFEGYDETALVTTVQAINSDTELVVNDAASQAVSGAKISMVNLSTTADKPTTFRFDAPVYIKEGIEYCVVLFTPCESYFAWISRMGEQEVGGTRMVSKQPHLGVLFKSQNNHTWSAYQMEDMKFTIFRAQFTTNTEGTLTLTNDALPVKTLGVDPIRTFNGSNVIQVEHTDNGMYSGSNNVTISGVSSGITTTGEAAGTGTGASSDITIVANASFVEDSGGSTITVKINGEIIQGTVQNSTTIRPTARGVDGTTSSIAAHASGSTVELYQLNGIPLDHINKTHQAVANTKLDSYTITLQSINANVSANGGGSSVTASENAQMDSMQTLLPTVEFPDTTVSSTIRTTSGTSPSGSETSFSLQSATSTKSITLGETVEFDKPQIIASTINETNELASSKSFFLNVKLNTTNQNISPMVDLDRKSVIAIGNRLNKVDVATDMGIASLQGDYVPSTNPTGDVNETIYITRKVSLETPATALRVILDINRFASANVKVMFKILRSDDASDFDEIGYNFFNTDGSPDSTVNPASIADEFKEHQYTAGRRTDGTGEPLDEFIAFAIKIVMQGTNSAEPPKIKDLRAIALAT